MSDPSKMPQTPQTQPTQPKKGEPVEIPVPKRGDFQKVLKQAAKGSATRRAGK